jgi:hypothetical protein
VEARLRWRCAVCFWTWLVLRTVWWTAISFVTQPNARLDLVEWLSWGHEWQWGYHKHPPLPAWIAEIFFHLTPGSMLGVYFAGYLCIAIALWCAWRLGRDLLPPRLALFAVLCLDGLVFFSYDPAEFNNNVVLDACWALTVLCLHRALRTDALGWWLGLGAAVGAGLLSKYSLAFLLAPLGLFLILHPDARAVWSRPGPYVAAALALVLLAPHAAWCVNHHFLTVRYGLDRAANDVGPWAPLIYPLAFVLSQLGRLLPVLLVLAPLLAWRPRLEAATPEQGFDRAYLLTAVLGPVVLLLCLSLATGRNLREIWGSPLWTFAGVAVLLFGVTSDRATAFPAAVRCWLLVFLAFSCYTAGKNRGQPLFTGRPSRIHFPGEQLARAVEERWHQDVSLTPLPIVVGECWLANNIACYGQPRPTVYPTTGVGYLVFDAEATPWVTDAQVRARGAALVWDADLLGPTLPDELRDLFPEAETQPPLVLPYQILGTPPNARIGLAFVRPSAETILTSAVSAR